MKINKRHQRMKRTQNIIAKAPTGAFPVSGGWNYRGNKKGSGGTSGPIEFPDTLKSTSYARLQILLSEGEIKGLVDGLKSVYLDGTPIQNADGSMNFSGVSVDFRTGTQYQDPMSGFPSSEVTESVGVELKQSSAFIKTIEDTQISAVRVTVNLNGLLWIDDKTGNRAGWVVNYSIDVSVDDGPYTEYVNSNFWGKTTSQYARTHRIDLPKASRNWRIRVRRNTMDTALTNLTDKTYVQSITRIIDAKLRYPNCAMVGIVVDAEQFSNIPTVACDCYGRILRIPSNYNPDTRQYDGTWDGTFKTGYTNNPAWVLYDLITNGRYGLGAKVDPAAVDKASLYKIAQYCDEMVDDGFGGKEPRFTCNAYVQTQAEAYKLLQDIAAIFRGVAYWSAGAVQFEADMPGDTDYTYTNANVIDGKFTYQGTTRESRYTVAYVSWNDPSDEYRQKVEVYEYREGINRYGIHKTDVTAFGCTSRSQARRLGKWLTLTSCLEKDTVTFSVGLDSVFVTPGKKIKIADQHRAGRRIGGRVRSATKKAIELDSMTIVKPGDRLTVILPDGSSQTRTVQLSSYNRLTADTTKFTADSTKLTADMTGIPESVTTITVTKPFSDIPVTESIWAIDSDELATQTFRVVSLTDNNDGTYTISAVQNLQEKYEAIDHGSAFDPLPISVVPPKVQPAPQNVRLSNYSVIDQGSEVINARIEWDSTEGANQYEVNWRRDNSDWVSMPRTGTTSAEIQGAYAGTYEARVRAYNAIGAASIWALSPVTELRGTIGAPPVVTHLSPTSLVSGIALNWGFPPERNIVERTEIWYSTSPERENATKLTELAYPTTSYSLFKLKANARLYFWARLIDKSGLAGAFYPEGNGVLGSSSVDASEILDSFAGQISETELGKNLVGKIETAEQAAVEVKSLADKLSAQWSAKVQVTKDGKHYLAGIGAGVEETPEGMQSQVLVLADRFAVINENDGSIVSPFVVDGGQVFMNEAVIGKLAAKHIQANTLSELTPNAGIITQGRLQSAVNGNYIDLNATGSNYVINFGNNAMTVTADGRMRINAVDVINTLNIAGGAVTSHRFSVNDSTTSLTTSPGSGWTTASIMDRSPTSVGGMSTGADIRITANISLSISCSTDAQGSRRCFGALQILKNGYPIRYVWLPEGNIYRVSGTSEAVYAFKVSIFGSSIITEDYLNAGESATYSIRALWWDNHGSATTCTITDSAIDLDIRKR